MGESTEKVPKALLATRAYIRDLVCVRGLPVARATQLGARSSFLCATAGCSPAHGHFFSVAGSQTQSSPSPAPPICNTKRKKPPEHAWVKMAMCRVHWQCLPHTQAQDLMRRYAWIRFKAEAGITGVVHKATEVTANLNLSLYSWPYGILSISWIQIVFHSPIGKERQHICILYSYVTHCRNVLTTWRLKAIDIESAHWFAQPRGPGRPYEVLDK